MDDRSALITEYLLLVNAELQRIGFTEDDFRYLGSGGELTRDALETQLAVLRKIPSGIGAQAYFARFGVDLAAVTRDSSRPPPDAAPPNERCS